MPNWLPIGSGISTVSRSSAAAIGCPARRPRTNTSSATGNWSCIFLRMRVARAWKKSIGMPAPISNEKVAMIKTRPPPMATLVAAMNRMKPRKIATGATSSASISLPVSIVSPAAISVFSIDRAGPTRNDGKPAGRLDERRRSSIIASLRAMPRPISSSRWLIARPSIRRPTMVDMIRSTTNTTAAKIRTRASPLSQLVLMPRNSGRGGTGRATG